MRVMASDTPDVPLACFPPSCVLELPPPPPRFLADDCLSFVTFPPGLALPACSASCLAAYSCTHFFWSTGLFASLKGATTVTPGSWRSSFCCPGARELTAITVVALSGDKGDVFGPGTELPACATCSEPSAGRASESLSSAASPFLPKQLKKPFRLVGIAPPRLSPWAAPGSRGLPMILLLVECSCYPLPHSLRHTLITDESTCRMSSPLPKL
mmetsp:Transcript_12405/g.39293  ORF Transcript_12405/g.39293 Transcript_12405/m.39293 type:complete len:213 (-) Transcript_12405:106-744(-)